MSENVFWVNSTKFQSHSCRNCSIPAESTGIQAYSSPFQCIPVLFRWNPAESCGIRRNGCIPAGICRASKSTVPSAQPNAKVVLGRFGEIGVQTAAETGPLKATDMVCSSLLLRMFQTSNNPSSAIPGSAMQGQGLTRTHTTAEEHRSIFV